MKRLTLQLLLMIAPGLGGDSVAFSNQAAVADAPIEGLGARAVYEYGTDHQINLLERKESWRR